MTPVQVIFYCCIAVVITSCGGDSAHRVPTPKGQDAGAMAAKGSDICLDVRSGKFWQVERQGPFSSHQEATRYVHNLQLAGYADWRLPTTSELFYLYYTFFWKKNGTCSLNLEGEYWSTDNKGQISLGHWETFILCDPEFKYVDSLRAEGFVRAIRP